jgi:hypothetical protein
MRTIRQNGTSFISVKMHNTTDASGLFIQKSTKIRTTEQEATSSPSIGWQQHYVTDQPPSPEHEWCSAGHWARRSTFGVVKGKRDYYCRQCRAEQQAKWRASQRR